MNAVFVIEHYLILYYSKSIPEGNNQFTYLLLINQQITGVMFKIRKEESADEFNQLGSSGAQNQKIIKRRLDFTFAGKKHHGYHHYGVNR